MSGPLHPPSRVPCATYRLQFNEHFRLDDARALIPYLEELGISHVYASPLFRARAHSTHGYDVCDFEELNPELGTDEDFLKFVTALHEHHLGLMVDIVPNHMGVWTPENRWWWDVLAHGRASQYAGYFDIDWESADPELRGKVLAPVLADDYDKVLQRGELTVVEHAGGFLLRHFDQLLPITLPASLAEKLTSREVLKSHGDSAGWLEKFNQDHAAFDALIRQQHYLPVCWKAADQRLNYRRFFSVATLAGVRVEDQQVFKDTHRLIRSWLKHGWLDGLRVDHPDGLRDPCGYLHRLRELAPTTWIVVEKILEPGEALPASWPVAGTTGYDFLNAVNGVLVDSEGEKPVTDFYRDFTGETAESGTLIREKKRMVLAELFPAEVNRLIGLLVRIAARHRRFRDLSRGQLGDALAELTACLPVYRTYVRVEDGAVAKADVAWIEQAAELARQCRPDLDPGLLDLLRDVLLLRLRGEAEDEFIARFQQLTGPAMAKGVEDSFLYCFNRLVSLNEVGGDPGRFGTSVHEFHEFCRKQQTRRPNAMLSTSTHDTKRSEDVRARINLLSEIPERWAGAVRRWSEMNEKHRRKGWPDRNAEYFFYQTLVGSWPLSVERALAYMEKATYEAGQHTSWAKRNEEYDTACRSFVTGVLGDAGFVADLKGFLAPLAEAGQVNALAQTLLKLTVPGVPDIYQGCDLWDFSLVDPDNRRTVDFELHRRLLADAGNLTAEAVWQRRDTGLPKLWLIRKVLTWRRDRPEIFDGSSRYDELPVHGCKAAHAIVFLRGNGAVTVAPRLPLKLNGDWEDTRLELPRGNWRNQLTEEDVLGASPLLSELLRKFPVALLARKEGA